MTGFLMQAHAAQIKKCSEFAGNAIAITECVGELIPSSGFYQCVRLLPPGAGPALCIPLADPLMSLVDSVAIAQV